MRQDARRRRGHDRGQGPAFPAGLRRRLGHGRIRHAAALHREAHPEERQQGYPSGRSQEIQRLIGRTLRAVTDLRSLGERQIIVDCDVIQADGGTRVASINAACVALALALKKMMDRKIVDQMPLRHLVGAISVGMVREELLLDLDYDEDSTADVDMNVVQTDRGQLLEVQATAERSPFSRHQLTELLKLADQGIREIVQIQKDILKRKSLLFMAYGER